jgi:hypothetical protein
MPISDRTPLAFDWFFIAIFAYAALLAAIRLQVPTMQMLFQQTLRVKKQKSIFSKENDLPKGLMYLLIPCSWFGFSLALAEILPFFGIIPAFPTLPFAFTAVFLYFSLKFLLKQITNGLFRLRDDASDMMPLAVKANFIWSLLALPLITINHYIENNYLIWVIFGIFCVNFLQKFILNGIMLFKKLRTLGILFYLCTIEILPLLLLMRYAINYFYEQ